MPGFDHSTPSEHMGSTQHGDNPERGPEAVPAEDSSVKKIERLQRSEVAAQAKARREAREAARADIPVNSVRNAFTGFRQGLRKSLASSAPPRPPLKNIVTASLAASIPLATLGILATSVSDLLLLPSIGAAMALIAGAPNLPLAQPRNVIVGHFTGAIIGVIILNFLGSSVLLSALAAAVTFAVLLVLRAAHSPATATSMVAVLTPHGNDLRFIIFILTASVIIVLAGIVVNRARGIKYPEYWW